MRQEELCAITWADLDAAKRMVTVRDRKDPRQKAGNDQRVPLLDITGYDATPADLLERPRVGPGLRLHETLQVMGIVIPAALVIGSHHLDADT